MPTERYTIFPDAEITRRKRYHLVQNSKNEIVWRARLFTEIIEWLYEQGCARARVVCEDDHLDVAIFINRSKERPI